MSHLGNDRVIEHQRDNLNYMGVDEHQVWLEALNKWGETAKSFANHAIDNGQRALVKMQMAREDLEETLHEVSKPAKEFEDARLEGEQLSNMIHSERVNSGSDWS